MLCSTWKPATTIEVIARVRANTSTGQKIDAHIEALRERSAAPGIDYFLLDTSKPLDEALREYLVIRQGRQ